MEVYFILKKSPNAQRKALCDLGKKNRSRSEPVFLKWLD
jgi:hypothetical protein